MLQRYLRTGAAPVAVQLVPVDEDGEVVDDGYDDGGDALRLGLLWNTAMARAYDLELLELEDGRPSGPEWMTARGDALTSKPSKLLECLAANQQRGRLVSNVVPEAEEPSAEAVIRHEEAICDAMRWPGRRCGGERVCAATTSS